MEFDLNKAFENLKEKGEALISFGKDKEVDTDERSSVEKYDDFLKTTVPALAVGVIIKAFSLVGPPNNVCVPPVVEVKATFKSDPAIYFF